MAPSIAWAGQVPEAHLRESLLNPDASISPGYEQVTLTASDGREIEGRMLSQTPSEVVILRIDDSGYRLAERIPTNGIRKTSQGELMLEFSTRVLMPAYSLSQRDLDDLVAFLRTVRGESTGGM